MAPPAKQNKNRRRKKRRTEDFSSDSDSDSSSASEQETQPIEPEEPKAEEAQNRINIDDIDVVSDTEEALADQGEETFSRETQQQLDKIKFTTTENKSLAEAKEIVKKDRQQLEGEFLAYMAGSFSNDLDELRKKPDFTEKSIVILAKTLQSGSNMFDEETLDALLNK